MNCAMAAQVAGVTTSEDEALNGEEDYGYNYVGQLHYSGSDGENGPLHSLLRQTNVGLSDALYHVQS